MLILSGSNNHKWQETTQPVMQELQRTGKSKPRFKWEETDTTLALLNREKIIWQYNFRTKHGKPFFHPVSAGSNVITCLSPDDHPWHLGEWFCWKYINRVNYWEYKKNTFQSEGITEIMKVEIEKNPDHSALITLWIDYHPLDGEVVMSEKRIIKVSPPRDQNRLGIDYIHEFKAIAEEVELGRTPIAGQPGGTSWGGYAGLSIRFNQDFMDSRFITQWGENDNINGQTGDWLYMGFTGTNGRQAGSQIMISPESKRDGAAWYSVNNPDLPFYYFSPAVLYFKHILLKKGDTLHLKYKVLHLEGEVTGDSLEAEFRKYAK